MFNLMQRILALSVTPAMLAVGIAVPPVAALELTEAELFFELNDTDGDLGLHASIDGGPYTTLEITDPQDRTLLRLLGTGSLAEQGLTQFMMESAEPTFEELPPEQFFERFPEGLYEIEVVRGDEEFETTVELSHVLAAAPSGITVSSIPAAENCDSDLLPVVNAHAPVIIDWEPVTQSHPEIGESGPVEITRYQFFVEQGDIKFAVDLTPTVTEFQVPEAITAPGGEFKFEIIARTTELNNTAIESCFVVE
jgi:hypothetical protein